MKRRLAATLLILAGALGGCGALERQQAADTERMLAAAGFHLLPADSAERQHDLAELPPYRIVASYDDAKAVYTYADPRNCHCLYVGGVEEYAELRRAEESEEIARSMTWGDF